MEAEKGEYEHISKWPWDKLAAFYLLEIYLRAENGIVIGLFAVGGKTKGFSVSEGNEFVVQKKKIFFAHP